MKRELECKSCGHRHTDYEAFAIGFCPLCGARSREATHTDGWYEDHTGEEIEDA